MSEQNYTPKYSRDDDSWDDSIWQTGSTEPPKSRGGLIALLLILVIFLCGIITLLGILNIRLFQKLQLQQNQDLAISFTVSETLNASLDTPEGSPEALSEEEDSLQICLDLQESAEGLENIPESGGLSLQDIPC